MELSRSARAAGVALSPRALEPPASDFDRIKGLAAMARALGRSSELKPLLETAAEEALLALRAASVSVEPGRGGYGNDPHDHQCR